LLAGIEEAAISAGKSKAIVRGRLRVNVDGTFGHYVLAPQIGEFLDRYPELSVEISVRDAMGDLVAEGVDVAVRFGAPEPSSLRARLLLETRVLTCASPAYVARHGAPIHPEQLTQDHQCLLIRDPTTGRPFEWEFQRGKEVVPLAASGRLMVNDTGSLLGACLGGTGVAQLLEIYARDLVAQNRLVHLLPDWADETFPLYAFHHSSNLVSAKVRAFLDFIRGLAS
jgi:DNA-binding transcriptional LysR family regulator